MPANTTPIFTLTPIIGMAEISTANTALDGSGTLGTVVTGGTNGTRITRITIQATATTTAGVIRLFIADNAGTPNIRLWREVLVPAITPSTTVLAFISTISLTGEAAVHLPASYTLRASTHNAEAFNIFAEGGNF